MSVFQQAVERLATVDAQVDVQVIRGVTLAKKLNGISVLSIHYSADPDRDPETEAGAEWYKAARAEYSSERRWKREQEIDPRASGGGRPFAKVLEDFHDKVIITDPDWKPDPRWDVVGGFDHGGVNPTALLKGYVDFAGNLYLAGEFYSYKRDDWENEVWQNAPIMAGMPDLKRMRWCMADPSIFPDTQVQSDGKKSSINKSYIQNGIKFLGEYSGERSDVTFVEYMLSAMWRDLGHRAPRLFIVCRNESDRLQPGLHPYDCPNLLWELKRTKRAELNARQLIAKNQTETIVDKQNHARDALKYMIFTLRRPTAPDFGDELREKIEGLNPTSAQIAAQRLYVERLRKNKKTINFRHKARMR